MPRSAALTAALAIIDGASPRRQKRTEILMDCLNRRPDTPAALLSYLTGIRRSRLDRLLGHLIQQGHVQARPGTWNGVDVLLFHPAHTKDTP